MKNVAIYQMVLPQYRIDFFNKLNENPNFNITIYCGEKFRSKPKSMLENAQFNFSIHSNSSFFKRNIFWQKNIKIPSYFKPNDLSRSRKSRRYSRFEDDENELTYTIDDIEKNKRRIKNK